MLGIEAQKSKRTGIGGWHTEAEEDFLVSIVQTLNFSPNEQITIVELGGEYGRSASEFAFALREKGYNGHVYTVDNFTDKHPIVGNLLEAYTHNLKACGLIDYVTPIKGDTTLQASHWNKPIDLLFIDAGHSYLSVKSDIAAWQRYVKPYGIIVFHDYAKSNDAHVTHLDVKRAVDEWYDGKQYLWTRHEGPDSIVWFFHNSPVQHEDSPKTISVKVNQEERSLAKDFLQATLGAPAKIEKEPTLEEILPEHPPGDEWHYPDYSAMGYRELRELALERGINHKKKDDILAALWEQDDKGTQ